MPTATEFLIALISTLIFIPINALILWATVKLFKVKSKYLTALKVAAIAGIALLTINQVLGLILGGVTTAGVGTGALLGAGLLTLLVVIAAALLVYTYLIKNFYKQETKKALLITIVYYVISFIVSMVVGAVIGVLLLAVIIGTGAGF